MKIAVIGAGLIGCERIKALQFIKQEINQDISISVFDVNTELLSKIRTQYQVQTFSDIQQIWELKPNWIFICTPHNVVIPIIKQAFKIGANVLVEKPLGRSLKECQNIIDNKPSHCKLYVGFNYRFFAGIEAALADCKNNKFGELISVNLILGHGNSPGMEKSWKLDPIKCGGGCLIDPGVHLLDLILEMSHGELHIDAAKSWSGFWNTGIEEEAHILMHDDAGTIFNTQVSINKWRSTFRLELNGTEGYGIVEGRGRSYGAQSYRTGTKWGWQAGTSQAASEKLVIDNNNCEDSFIKETLSILDISKTAASPCNHLEAEGTMNLLQQCKEVMKDINNN